MTKSSSHSKSISSANKTIQLAETYLRRVKSCEAETHRILATHESSLNRIITIEETHKQLKDLSIKQEKLLEESISCVEHRLFRSAHVLSWAAFMDYIEEKLGEDNFIKLTTVRTNWNIKTKEDLEDIGSDFQIIETLRKVGLCGKTVEKNLKGLLSKRNECAHPSEYEPELNETLGYISEIMKRLKYFEKKQI